MATVPTDLDITSDLNSQGDAQPTYGNDIPENRLPAVPTPILDDKKEAPTPSLRDTLTDAFKGAEAPPSVVPPVDPAAPPAVPTELVKVGDRWHNKDGTFASREQIEAQAAATGQPVPIEAPSWTSYLTPLEQQQFTALPAEIRGFLERTMDNVNARGARYGEYDSIEQLIGPRRQAWAQQGTNTYGALNQLFALSDFAGRSPSEFVLWFSDQHKLDLDALLDARDEAGTNGQADPRFLGLQQEIANLRNTIGGLTNATTQQQYAQNLGAVQAFMDERDEKGNLLHPYFADVANDIAMQTANIRQQQPYLNERDVLKAAYDFATYSNPNIRHRVQESQAQALKDRAAAEAARARQAGVSINGGPAGDASTQPNNANRTLRDELLHAYNQNTA